MSSSRPESHIALTEDPEEAAKKYVAYMGGAQADFVRRIGALEAQVAELHARPATNPPAIPPDAFVKAFEAKYRDLAAQTVEIPELTKPLSEVRSSLKSWQDWATKSVGDVQSDLPRKYSELSAAIEKCKSDPGEGGSPPLKLQNCTSALMHALQR